MDSKIKRYVASRKLILWGWILAHLTYLLLLVVAIFRITTILFSSITAYLVIICLFAFVFLATIGHKDPDDIQIYIIEPEDLHDPAKTHNIQKQISQIANRLKSHTNIKLLFFHNEENYLEDNRNHSPFVVEIGKKQNLVIPKYFYIYSNEFIAILAHEIGHIIFNHTIYTKSLIPVQILLVVFSIFLSVLVAIFYSSILILMLSLILNNTLIIQLAQRIRWSNEYAADGIAVMAGYGEELISELGKYSPENVKTKILDTHPNEKLRIKSAKKLLNP